MELAGHDLLDHQEDCFRKLGRPFTEVHQWMDYYSCRLKTKHRVYCHNILDTSKEALSRFGEGADKACRIHIVRDFLDNPMNVLKFAMKYRGKCLYEIIDSWETVRKTAADLEVAAENFLTELAEKSKTGKREFVVMLENAAKRR